MFQGNELCSSSELNSHFFQNIGSYFPVRELRSPRLLRKVQW